ncbi:flagellar basal body-associated FliL family protein [Massilia endophytica]|uniref:flagellar basal body-associated FliL family protein n=1 Tax=Massilia endophytica TaxID=2899220 RepID=UPI001E3B466E|nr:flagellar basal body-associated FliL family protein [Massilia endophytica]UGQ48969.1 flagellar basal body-associated FliL family protein [Massilia endophytica]
MNKKLVIVLASVALLGAAAAGGALWYIAKPATAAGKKAAPVEEAKPMKYLTVDKVIVMLRRSPGENAPHYMSADLVVATPVEKEKETKEHLPMLRSVAVRTLSAYPMSKAESMTIDQYAEELNKAFDETYAREARERPFKEVLIGKLILE